MIAHPTALPDGTISRLLALLQEVEVSANHVGFPCITEAAFRAFQDEVPHLFRNGLHLLCSLSLPPVANRVASADVLRHLVLNAAVCAPPDLWLLRHVLAAQARVGTLTFLLGGGAVVLEAFAEAHSLDDGELAADLDLLHGRGYLDRVVRNGQGGAFVLSRNPTARSMFVYAVERMRTGAAAQGWVPPLSRALLGTAEPEGIELARGFLELPNELRAGVSEMIDWVAGPLEVEIGYRLVPLVLALHEVGIAPLLAAEGMSLAEAAQNATAEVAELLTLAGLIDDGRTTPLAARVFGRGAGPFGIIHSYYPFVEGRERILRPGSEGASARSPRVVRSENVHFSQEANRKTFHMAHDALDAYCSRYGFHISVFIEHAFGLGEATRQRWHRDQALGRAENISYVGVDLEDTPIQRARAAQQAGALPPELLLVSGVDIGQPSTLLDALKKAGLPSNGAVMMVGNGFHEVRNQTDARMVEVFRAYAEAGIILIFTEETALSSDDLRATGWNTYHAGFRYVHALSGQGLRPAITLPGMPRSWRACAEQGGYVVLDEFSRTTRGIYPCERPHNPPISVTYFAVPIPNVSLEPNA